MRDKLIWKFLWAYIPLILLSVLVLNFFVSFSLRGIFEQKITEQLYSNSLLIGKILHENIENEDRGTIQRQVNTIGEQLDQRITVIDTDGVVLGDSQKDPAQLDNHGDRPEIIEALESGKGASKRFSDTLNFNMEYVAVPLKSNGQIIGVIRSAIALTDVDDQIRVIYRAVLLGGIVTALLIFILGYYISRSITNPISEMRTIAEKISSGDFSQKLNIKSKDELGSLAKSFNKMAADLQARIESLKQMDKVRTDFVANVSHELKTPLTSIKGYVETLQDGALDDKGNAEKFLGIIQKHTDSLTHIVDDLLILSEAELGKDRLEISTFDLKDLFEEIVPGFGHTFKEKALSVESEIRGESFTVSADKGKIEQVFVNIIDNAAKYTKKGGHIRWALSKENGMVVVTIEDDGIGIPAQDAERVFERFYRVDKARSRDEGGTGLGLSIVKHIISLHNGKVRIDSDVDQGTKVLVSLPSA